MANTLEQTGLIHHITTAFGLVDERQTSQEQMLEEQRALMSDIQAQQLGPRMTAVESAVQDQSAAHRREYSTVRRRQERDHAQIRQLQTTVATLQGRLTSLESTTTTTSIVLPSPPSTARSVAGGNRAPSGAIRLPAPTGSSTSDGDRSSSASNRGQTPGSGSATPITSTTAPAQSNVSSATRGVRFEVRLHHYLVHLVRHNRRRDTRIPKTAQFWTTAQLADLKKFLMSEEYSDTMTSSAACKVVKKLRNSLVRRARV